MRHFEFFKQCAQVQVEGSQHHHHDKKSFFLFRFGLFLSLRLLSWIYTRATNDEKTLSTNCVWSGYTTTRKKGESPQSVSPSNCRTESERVAFFPSIGFQ